VQKTRTQNTAVEILRSGRLVAFPTETVYGLGADATNSSAIEKIFTAKGRPATNPLIVHVADVQTAKRHVTHWPAITDRLAAAFWPGPLTLVLPRASSIVDQVTAGGSTVGIRVPNHPLALQLLREFAGPIAAPSANRANHISPTTAADVLAELADRVDLILDGGPCGVGIESTVLDLNTHPPRILRPGGTSRAQIEAIIGPVDLFDESTKPGEIAASPGQQPKHYSPTSPAFWFDSADRAAVLNASNGIAIVLGTGLDSRAIITLPNDPELYARNLYQTLRRVDARRPAAIYIEMPPDEPRWLAVRDRLRRAARRVENANIEHRT
jgi:L-threonylcarbamoyladenylate synthase